MSANPKHYFTLNEYLAVDKVSEARLEYWDGDIICVNGQTKEHAMISSTVAGELHNRLKNQVHEAFICTLHIKTPTLPPYRYADASVSCGKAIFEHFKGQDLLVNPIVLVEVISEHTDSHDRTEKFEAYKAIETMQEYLLIEQKMPHVTHYIKQESGNWKRFDTADLTATLTLNSISCTLSLQDIYDGIEFN